MPRFPASRMEPRPPMGAGTHIEQGFQIAIRVPGPGLTSQSCSEAIPYLCNALQSRLMHSGVGFAGIIPNVEGPRQAYPDCTVIAGP
jgi:hypothetical protein